MSIVDELKKQWLNTKEFAGAATRIDAMHPLEWYIGYDSLLNKALIIIGTIQFKTVKSSKAVQIVSFRREDKRWMLRISLLEAAQDDVFMNMCADLLFYSGKGKDEKSAYELFQNRYNQWDKLFQHGKIDILSEEEQRGLLGELLFLKEQFADRSMLNAVKGWFGPDRNHQDFLYDSSWYEIKTVLEAASSVKISSLQQLAPLNSGKLAVNRLRLTAEKSLNAMTLNSVVEQLYQILESDITAMNLFSGKLLDAGYILRTEYDDKSYLLIERVYYEIRDDFPRLTVENIPSAITGASYILSLPAIEKWRV